MQLLTRALVGSVTRAGGGQFCAPSYLRNYWPDPQNTNGVRKPCQLYRGNSNFIDLGVTDDVTGQFKGRMFHHSQVF